MYATRMQFPETLRGFDAVYGWEVTIGDGDIGTRRFSLSTRGTACFLRT